MSPAAPIRGPADPVPQFRRDRRRGAWPRPGLAASISGNCAGGKQQVAVDTRQATASLRSGHYMKMETAQVSTAQHGHGRLPGQERPLELPPLQFPEPSRRRAERAGRAGGPRGGARKAVAKWDALELEEAIIAAKGAGGMVRTMAEWAKHPQAAAIASLPLLEIVKIGDSPPRRCPTATGRYRASACST